MLGGGLQPREVVQNGRLVVVDKGHSVDIVNLDFAKAFDKVPHMRLIRKCEGLGIQGNILKCIKEWLRERKQRVVLNGHASK